MKGKLKKHLFDAALTLLLLLFSTLIGLFVRRWEQHEANVVVVYLFSVLLISRFTHGYHCGIAASVISLGLFNWFFTEPFYTLKVQDATYLFTFSIMMITSVVTSTLTTKVIKAAADARQRERESGALYTMTNHLTDAQDAQSIARITVTTAGEVLNCPTACICFDDEGQPERSFLQRRADGELVRRELTDAEELRRRMENLHTEADLTQQDCLYPIYGRNSLLAVLRIPGQTAASMTQPQTRMLHSIIESAALALERLRSLQQQARSREETAQERYRANLLRAISHDIRTPLSGIMGTGEMLLDSTPPEDPRHALVQDVCRDARWLHGMVENILSLTRLQDGRLALQKEPEAVEEVIEAALLAMEKRGPERVIDVEMPGDVLIVPMDARLVSQVLINLLDNAARHTPCDREICIRVSRDASHALLQVCDRGTGISPQDLPHIFEMFYTTGGRSTDARRGVGLGLAICQSIVEAHGGTIRAENREGGGACFTFTLPLEEEAS